MNPRLDLDSPRWVTLPLSAAGHAPSQCNRSRSLRDYVHSLRLLQLWPRGICVIFEPRHNFTFFGVCAPHRICQESSRNCWIRLLRTVHSRTCVFAYTCCSIRHHFARPGQEWLGPSLGESVFFTFVEIQISVFLQESESIGSLEHVSNEHLENRPFFKNGLF